MFTSAEPFVWVMPPACAALTSNVNSPPPVTGAEGKENALSASVSPPAPVGPVAPVAPVTPVGPVAPVAPVTPVAPVGPVAPTAPVTPVAPVAPVEHVTYGKITRKRPSAMQRGGAFSHQTAFYKIKAAIAHVLLFGRNIIFAGDN